MGRAHVAALLAGGYLVWMFVAYRVRLLRRRGEGPSLALLSRFDYRMVWGELGQPYRAGLPTEAAAPSLHADASMAPDWYRASAWESPALATLKPARDALLAGETPPLDVASAGAVSLLLHFYVRRLLGGDFAGARACATQLPDHRRVLEAVVDAAEAERAWSVRDVATAQRHLEHAFGLLEHSPERTQATLSLRIWLRLAHRTHALNLEYAALTALREAQVAARQVGDRPFFFHLRAWAYALLGRTEESIDELGRALYYARGDAFYARAILESPAVEALRPALFAQARAPEHADAG